MLMRYKRDILAELKKAGYSTYRLHQQKIFSETVIQHWRHAEWVAPKHIARASILIGCSINDLVEFIPDEDDKAYVHARK